MEYLAVTIYIESFAGTCLKTNPPTSYVYICLNEETIGGLCCPKKYFFYNIDMICEKY